MVNLPRALTVLILTIFVLGTTVFAQKRTARSSFAGAVFAMTNATESNEIVTYARTSDGTLTRLNNIEKTRGLGIGVDTEGVETGGLPVADGACGLAAY